MYIYRIQFAKMVLDSNSNYEIDMLSIAVIAEEEKMVNEGRVSPCGFTLGHSVIQYDQVQGNDRFYRGYFAETQ